MRRSSSIRVHVPWLYLLAGVGACADAPQPDAPSTAFEVKVAPLTLPGLGDACYDVEVRNEANQIVWARGDFNVQHPADTTTLCARRFGNGPGGDISYVGPCDADAPEHTVFLVVDTLYDAGGVPLTDWQNPCPGGAPCSLRATCTENADTPVSFNLTIMRAAQQGFFDVAVNFDAIFCSAKVDCTYDAAGLEPIELIHDPATGERTQTAVIGLACSAGPGSDVDTALLMSDIRFYCGDTPVLIGAGAGVIGCEDDGQAFYGILQAFTSTGVTFDSVVWRRDGATGDYVPDTVTVTDPDGLAPLAGLTTTPPYDSGIPFVVLEDGADTYAIGLLGKFGPMTGGQPDTAIEALRAAIFQKTGDNPNTWKVNQVLAFPDGFNSNRPIVLPELSAADEYLVAMNGFDPDADSPGEATLFAIYVYNGAPWTYSAPVLLSRDTTTYYNCDRRFYPGVSTFVLACENAAVSGRWDLLVYDLTATPSGTLPNGLSLSPTIIPLLPSDFHFDGGLEATAVVRVQDVGAVGGGTGVQVLANVEVQIPGVPDTRPQLVHFTRSGGTWEHAAPILGRANLARDPVPQAFPIQPNSFTNFSFLYELDGGVALLGGYMYFLEGEAPNQTSQYRPFVARYSGGVWTGPWTFNLEWPHLNGALVAPNGDLYVYGDRLTAPWPVGEREAFYARLPMTPGPTPIVPLPRPGGWVHHFDDALRGVRGPNRPSDLTRRLAGLVLEPDGAGSFQRHAIEWRLLWDTDSAAFSLASWSVLAPTEPIEDAFGATPDPDPDWSGSLRENIRETNEASPRFATTTMRCDEVVEGLDAGGEIFGGSIISHPSLDLNAGLDAVTSVTTLDPHIGSLSGSSVVREPVLFPEAQMPELDTSGAALLDPTHTAEGNIWSSTNPRPAGLPAHILQMASYHGEESLDCDGEPCNKLYWNTAIAFDPTVPDCRLAFEATAARVSSLVGGQLPPNTSWPVIIGRVDLTTSAEEGQTASLACTQHPLGSAGLQTRYMPQDFDWEACYGFGTTGSPPAMSGGGECEWTAGDYLMFEALLESGGDGP